MSSYDKQALAILLSDSSKSQKDSALAALARRANNEFACPSCGHEGPHEDNGGTGADLTYLCLSCGHQFE